mmetsp:Transcript_888/g.1651  ORF Transcript_888/g.1651 Transcript_888/m.1651 type:complete len:844 (-) Transcript_888:45-2576(-)
MIYTKCIIPLFILCTTTAFVLRPAPLPCQPNDQRCAPSLELPSSRTFLSSTRSAVQADRSSDTRTSNNGGQRGGQRRNYNTGGGGGGSPVLNLANPMKIQRVVEQVAETDEERKEREERQQQRNDRRNGDRQHQARKQTGPRRVASVSDGVAAGGPSPEPGQPNDVGRKRNQKRGRGAAGNDSGDRGAGRGRKGSANEDSRNSRRTSLRVGSGNRNRGRPNQSRGSLRRRDRSAEKEAKAEAALERKTVLLPEGPISVSELADILDEKPVSVIKFLMTDLGVMASMTQSLDPATCIAVVEGFGRVIGGDEEMDEEMMEILSEDSALSTGFVEEEDDPELLAPRAPVVTIMGHVDHGKTSLLDAIRKTDVTAGEAGGITQHIAAYQVKHEGQKITFIDTPGHAAFTDMRERGANITDIVILVVAADDGVKQQTVDSINCARQAGVPLVVAINKCDLETADPTRVMTELTQYDILTEEFGGEILASQISAKTKSNLDDLLDKIMMQAELQGMTANPDRSAEGIVVEANVERGLGTVATTLIKRGTLRVGDIFVAGETYGRVRALISTADGKTRLDEATPSTPVRIVGFEGIPAAGDAFAVAETEQLARELAESRQRISRERESSAYQADLMGSVARTFGANKERREMCVLVKADVQGTAEALTRSLRELKLENDEAVVTVKVLVSEAGEVSKSDVSIASVTPDTTILAFNVAASFAAMEDARINGINIEYYNIVYDAIESIESRMQEVLSPTPDGEYTGSALVQEVFNIGGTGNIAGSRCQDGRLRKGGNARVMRGDKILTETKIKSLRNFKAEVDVIDEGNECGIGLIDFENFEAGDVIECYVE